MGDLLNQVSEPTTDSELEDTSQYLTFLAGKETFAIGILDVKEIIEVSNMTNVPMTPDHIHGVINLRGSVVPVIDLSSRLGGCTSALTKRSCIILVEVELEHEYHSIGMLVDEVNEILEINQDHIQPPPNFGTDIRTDFIQAMGRVDSEFIVLLAINNVLSVEELAQLDELTQSQPPPPASDDRQYE